MIALRLFLSVIGGARLFGVFFRFFIRARIGGGIAGIVSIAIGRSVGCRRVKEQASVALGGIGVAAAGQIKLLRLSDLQRIGLPAQPFIRAHDEKADQRFLVDS